MAEEARGASVRTYLELIRFGNADPHAFETAVTVLRMRHPDVSRHDARHLVADWICEHIGH